MDTLTPQEQERIDQTRPLQKMLGRLSNKWNVLVIRRLARHPMRPSEMQKDIGNISHKMLTHTLRELESYGLVERTVFPVVPPKVEYALTELGETLVGPLDVLFEWAVGNIDQVEAAISRYEKDNAG